MVTSEQIRAARALLRWEQADLANASGVSLPSIKRLESVPGPLIGHERTMQTLRCALETAGVEFMNDGRRGVQMRLGPPRWKRAIIRKSEQAESEARVLMASLTKA